MTRMAISRGRFITFEGGEGSGKSTQAARLVAALAERGIEAHATREPGGTEGAEAIRALLVEGEPGRWDAWTEALLMIAARRDHVVRLIRPALDAGTWVISDRFADSTLVYQGIAGGLGVEALTAMMDPVLDGCEPDLTLVLDLPVATGLARAAGRGGAEDRFERLGAGFHERVNEGFRQLARDNPDRCRLIDADRPVDAVAADVLAAVEMTLLAAEEAPVSETAVSVSTT